MDKSSLKQAFLLTVALSALSSKPVWALCAPLFSPKLSLVSSSSQWQEFDTSGKRLVQETGVLSGSAVELKMQCQQWFGAVLQQNLNGLRDYDGITNTGNAVTNMAQVSQNHSELRLGYIPAPELKLWWGLSQTGTSRSLPAIGAIRGFDERFTWGMYRLGMQYAHNTPYGQWHLRIDGGKSYNASSHFQITGRDRSQLQLGMIHERGIATGWRFDLGKGWALDSTLGWQSRQMGRGPEGLITQNGVPVGTAFQPQSVIRDRLVAFLISRDF